MIKLKLLDFFRKLRRRLAGDMLEASTVDPELRAITERAFNVYAIWRRFSVEIEDGWVKRDNGDRAFKIYGVEPRVSLYDTYTFALPRESRWQMYLAVMIHSNVYYVELKDAEKAKKCKISYWYKLDGEKIHENEGTLWDAYKLETNGIAIGLDSGSHRLEFHGVADGETCGRYEVYMVWRLDLG